MDMAAMLNRNVHTSYLSHAVNYSHEYVTFWYVWNIRMTKLEILIGLSFSQMSNFRRVKNSHVFVTSVRICSIFSRVTNTCEFFTRVTNSFQCEKQTNVSQVWKFERICHICEEFVRIFHRCDKCMRILHFCDGLARIFHICNTYAWPVWNFSTDQNLVWCLHNYRHWGEPNRQVSFQSTQ